MSAVLESEFEQRTVPFHRELLTHCYRLLGSIQDAEDLLQETLLRAWRAYDRFDDRRASLRTWLYRIATNACLTALKSRSRRPLPSAIGSPWDDPDAPLVRQPEVPWLQPFPDTMLGDDPNDPARLLAARGSLRLAFVAALQLLPARQRAILVLREVLEWPADEVAATLGTTVAAVNSGLQRARATLTAARIVETDVVEANDPKSRTLVDRFMVAFLAADVAALAKLVTEDVILEMPPFPNWYVGQEDYLRFVARIFRLRGNNWRMFHTAAANGQPALAAYLATDDGGYRRHTFQVLTIAPEGISRITVFQDSDVFEAFGLAETMDERDFATR